jgi:hypothetical protein
LNDFNFELIVEVRAASEARNRNEKKLTFVPFAASGEEGSEQSFAAIRFNVCFNPIPKAETWCQGEGYWTRLLEPIFGVISTKCALPLFQNQS